MSSRLGNTGVGELFSKPPARASGLAGTLGPRPHLVPAPEPTPPESPQDAEVLDAPSPAPAVAPSGGKEARARKASTPRPDRQPKDEPAQARRLVVVYVTQADFEWVSQRRKATDLTNAQIILAAIEAAAPELPERFRTKTSAAGSRMFATPTSAPLRSRERHVQLGLAGILTSDRETLDRLVADTGAQSLSALVRAAVSIARAGE